MISTVELSMWGTDGQTNVLKKEKRKGFGNQDET